MRSLAGATSGSLPALRDHLWLSPPDAERAAQTLGPLFSKVRRGLEKLLRECVTLEVALERNTEPHIMALLLPDYWADFIRSGPIEDEAPGRRKTMIESQSRILFWSSLDTCCSFPFGSGLNLYLRTFEGTSVPLLS